MLHVTQVYYVITKSNIWSGRIRKSAYDYTEECMKEEKGFYCSLK